MHNDVIGSLEIGWDGTNRLSGYVFLKWQQLERKVRRQKAPGVWETIENPARSWRGFLAEPSKHSMVPDYEIPLGWVDVTDNKSCFDAITGIMKDARRHIRKRFHHAEVWLPPFGLECTNWVEAIRQARERAEVQKGARRG